MRHFQHQQKKSNVQDLKKKNVCSLRIPYPNIAFLLVHPLVPKKTGAITLNFIKTQICSSFTVKKADVFPLK